MDEFILKYHWKTDKNNKKEQFKRRQSEETSEIGTIYKLLHRLGLETPDLRTLVIKIYQPYHHFIMNELSSALY